MKEIQTIRLVNARNGEHVQFHTDVLAVLTAELAATFKIETLHTVYAELFAREDAAFAISRGLASTADIETKDEARDRITRYLFQMIEAKRLSPVEAESKAAESVTVKISPYRNAHLKPYAQNTAEVANMVSDLQGDDCKEEVATLGIAATVEQLKTANDEFNAVYTGRSDEKLGRAQTDKMKTVRPLVDDAYRDVVKAINALYSVNALITKDADTETALAAVIDKLNALGLQLTETVSLRTARAAGKKKPKTTE